MSRLILATRNAHKTREIGRILGPGWSVADLNSFPMAPDIEETAATFAGNAALKALSISAAHSGWVLADDSGLEVDALHGAPGVFSARFAGADADDAANRAKLLQELDRVGACGPQRAARFRCAMVLARDGRVVETFEGTIGGAILSEERGQGGFGYDCLFVPEGFSQTFAELPEEEKNRISHRSRALAGAATLLAKIAGSPA